MTMVISTSFTEARMVVVRSWVTAIWMEGGIEACSTGSSARTRSTVSIMLACGWRNSCRITRVLAVHRSGVANVLLAVDHRGHVGQSHGGAVVVGHDQRRIVLGDEELIVVVEDVVVVRRSAAGLWANGRWPR